MVITFRRANSLPPSLHRGHNIPSMAVITFRRANSLPPEDAEVTRNLEAMRECEGIDDADGFFSRALVCAIHRVQEGRGGVIVPSGNVARPKSRPCNPWFGAECKAARRAFREAVRGVGAASSAGRQAYREYKRVTQSARRAWESERDAQVLRDVRCDPKAFWEAFGRQSRKGGGFPLAEWSKYFKELFQANSGPEACAETRGEAGPEPDGARPVLFPPANANMLKQAADLNKDFSVLEITLALRAAANGKSAGVDGLPMEFMKHAVREVEVEGKTVRVNILAGHITHLFNRVLRDGYPKGWAVGAIVPVPKPKGNPDKMDDYRGIAVGGALSKLFSLTLLRRMDEWAEDNGMRAAGQAGFRQGRGTPDNAFVLHHVIEKYRSSKKPVFAAFIDFRKAYDSVGRPVLWECLRSLGVHGRFLNTLEAMYHNVHLQVRANGVLGEPFESFVGVKQGDPLSPLLFGLFIDRLEGFLRDELPLVGVHVGHLLIQILLYADDLVLMAESAADLQQCLDVLKRFCDLTGMQVNVRKSEAVIFNRQFARRVAYKLYYQGADLEVKDLFVYLGMLFESVGGVAQVARRSLAKGRGACFGMLRRCESMGLHNMYIKCRLFDTLVRPVLLYGCEVWGPAVLKRGCFRGSGFLTEMEKFHKGFLRSCLGVRKSVPDAVVMLELRRQPIALCMLRQLMGFAERVWAREGDDVVKIAMQESFSLAQRGVRQCWAAQLMGCLGAHGVVSREGDVVCGGACLDVGSLQDQWVESMAASELPMSIRSIPDEERTGFKVRKYVKWFADVACDVHDTFWYQLSNPRDITAVARFRMASHNLNVERQRFAGPSRVGRSGRVCVCCSLGEVEDELHVLSCPLYADVFESHKLVFERELPVASEDVRMNFFMNKSDDPVAFWRCMASFLRVSDKKRNTFFELLA